MRVGSDREFCGQALFLLVISVTITTIEPCCHCINNCSGGEGMGTNDAA